MTGPKPWKPGDRVIVRLPDGPTPRGYRKREADVHGTVREVDPPGLRPGVRVDLDREINGVWDCYATHRELRPEVPDGCPCVRCKANPEIREPQEAVADVSGELLCLPHLREALKEEPGVAFVSTEWGWREPGRRAVFELHRLDGEAARALTASRRARGQEVTLVRRTVTYGEWETAG